MPPSHRSAPSVTPGLAYHDAAAAIDWLVAAFGFEKRLVVPGANGSVLHAHLTIGHGGVMLGSAENHAGDAGALKTPRQLGGASTQDIYVWIEDVDAHCARARAAGAQILIDVEDKPYGGRGYACLDLEGHRWSFGSYDPWAD